MKNKTKNKTHKSANKKSRPKKIVEAKVFESTPGSTQISQEPKALTLKIKLLPGQTQEDFIKNALSAINTFYDFATSTVEKGREDLEQKLVEEREKFIRLCGMRMYKDPGIGLIHRHNYENENTRQYKYIQTESGGWIMEKITDSTYVKMLGEEKEASREENEKVQANIRTGYRHLAKLYKKQIKVGWVQKLFNWFK